LIKIFAEKRAGELLREIQRSPGGRPAKNSCHDDTSFQGALHDAGISPKTAHRWQQESHVPDRVVESEAKRKTAEGQELTSRSIQTMGAAIASGATDRDKGLRPEPMARKPKEPPAQPKNGAFEDLLSEIKLLPPARLRRLEATVVELQANAGLVKRIVSLKRAELQALREMLADRLKMELSPTRYTP
jgi:hypothetical protein